MGQIVSGGPENGPVWGFGVYLQQLTVGSLVGAQLGWERGLFYLWV